MSWTWEPLPLLSPPTAYDAQAGALLDAHRRGDPGAIRLFHERHPRFLDPVVTWKPRRLAPDEIAAAALDLDDARLALARRYSFRDWEALSALVADVLRDASPVQQFELAVEAVVSGDLDALDRLLDAHPDLVRARSTRVTPHDPPAHGATLLHYLAANGVEGHRQVSPPNAVAVAQRLFDAGADPDALAAMYGGTCPTLPMLVSSTPPAEAGVQVPLVHALIDAGADVEGGGEGSWRSALTTALVFGFTAAADALVSRGARVDRLVTAAGLGRLAAVDGFLPGATAADRHAAFALAAQLGHVEVVRRLLDAGELPDRRNPDGFHAHATPLHQAAIGGHLAVVELLVDRGARLDIRDTLWDGTPLGWAEYGQRPAVAAYLRARTAPP
ncbi:MAG: ankyrin repeat domain-containing protein [Vicinamibacterales bacterium]